MNYNFSTLYRLYALELSNKKWFIYTTKETDTKNIDLNSKLLYQFVSNNLPILSHNSTQLNDVLEVNFYVKKYMRLYGIKNVRGGSYSDEVLSDIKNGYGPHDYKLVMGYSGWGSGQLEAEVQNGDWIIMPSSKELIFSKTDKNKWNIAIKNMNIDFNNFSGQSGLA